MEDTGRNGEEVMNTLARVIGAIGTVKDLVPIEIGKTILSAASTILLLRFDLSSGEISKDLLAKVILNDLVIEVKFKDHRFFIYFDYLLSSQITYNTFIECIARTLGVMMSASGGHREVSDFLRSEDILIVLNSAETLLDYKATKEIPPINRAIAESGDYLSVAILVTSRVRKLPHDLAYTLREVPPLDKGPAIEAFTGVLDSVMHHPLSMILLARAGEENQWSIEELLAHWSAQHTQLLSMGYGKDDNMAKSIELSLSSPSVNALGDDVRDVLRTIAFFPQGVLREKLEGLFRTVSGTEGVISVLNQSLFLSNNGFITMLAPIRLYLSDACPNVDLLPPVRKHYYGELSLGEPSCDAVMGNSVDRPQLGQLRYNLAVELGLKETKIETI
ncbi:hypothetical protein HYDPIDRAFT_186964 [Hydnomerulius pinastri MD-312]|nr:hypothetical protein HYDPIDRAFT_186964 [Hydnomerulius pinastri MD-312]